MLLVVYFGQEGLSLVVAMVPFPCIAKPAKTTKTTKTKTKTNKQNKKVSHANKYCMINVKILIIATDG